MEQYDGVVPAKLTVPAPSIDPGAVWDVAVRWATETYNMVEAMMREDGHDTAIAWHEQQAATRRELRALLGLVPEG